MHADLALRARPAAALRRGRPRGVLALILLLLGVAVYRWSQFTGFAAPPGSDGGQWLAFGHQMLTGEHVKAGISLYPPLVPIVVGTGEYIVGPMLALKLTAFATSLLIAVPAYLLFRSALPWWLAAPAATLPTVSAYHAEVLSFGGYPQLVGTALAVTAVHALGRGLAERRRSWLLASAILGDLTVSAHALAASELALASALLVGLFAWRARHQAKARLRILLRAALLWWLIPLVVLALPFLPFYLVYVVGAQRDSGLTISQTLEWFNSSWRWEAIGWLAIAGIGAILLLSRFNRHGLLSDLALVLPFTAVLGLLATGELRFIELFEVGLILWLGIAMAAVLTRVDRTSSRFRLAGVGAVLLALLLIPGLVGHRRAKIALDWYRVLDRPAVAGLDWLRENGAPGQRVVATAAPRGHNYGWWIEGYAHMPAYAAVDESLFLDKDEQRKVALARELIAPDTPPDVVRAIADDENIRYLFLDRSLVPDPGKSLVDAGFVSTFQNSRVRVMAAPVE